ncbi:MAG: hypothetical protein JXR76_17520 [Deltaproteobacteria bacterium]|nr:hypothetical protein [Deltaproteobacteria bacterium]
MPTIALKQTPMTLPIREYRHPVSLGALLLLIVNDHCLKGAGVAPGWLTGKLSDVAGMIFFPLLLTALWNTLRFASHLRRRPSTASNIHLERRQLIVSITISALLLTALQTCPEFVAFYESVLATCYFPTVVTSDITDLIALPALYIPWRIGNQIIRAQEEQNPPLSPRN